MFPCLNSIICSHPAVLVKSYCVRTHSLKLSSNNANKQLMKFENTSNIFLGIYTTKGRDRFHWAATPLKPYKVRNICCMKYRYGVLYFLNLSLKKKNSTENGNFCENIQIRRPLSFRVLTRSRMPNRRTSQSKIEDTVHIVSASVC